MTTHKRKGGASPGGELDAAKGADRRSLAILLDVDADGNRQIIRMERDEQLATAEGLAAIGLVTDRALHLVIDGILDRANMREVRHDRR